MASTPEQRKYSHDFFAYLDAMAELWPRLSAAERQEKLNWERSEAFNGDRNWPGWVKYLGPPPQPPARVKVRRTA